MISVFSVAAGVIWLNLAMVLVMVLRKSNTFRIYYSSRFLVWVATLALIRILVPLDLKYAFVINSYDFLRNLQRFLAYPALGPLSVGQVLLVLWGIGSLEALLREGRQIWNEAAQLRQLKTVRSPKVEQIAGELKIPMRRIVVSPEVGMPFSGGFLFQKAYLPPLDLSEADLRWILGHERQHMKGHDTSLKLFYLLLEILFWWNPVTKAFQSDLGTLLEHRCDQMLLRDVPQAERLSYSDALIRAERQVRSENPAHSFCTMSFVQPQSEQEAAQIRLNRKEELTERILCITEGKPPSKWVSALLMILCFLIFIASYFVLIQPAGKPPEEEISEVVTITQENAYLVHNEDNQYELWVDGNYFCAFEKSDLNANPLKGLEVYEEGEK